MSRARLKKIIKSFLVRSIVIYLCLSVAGISQLFRSNLSNTQGSLTPMAQAADNSESGQSADTQINAYWSCGDVKITPEGLKKKTLEANKAAQILEDKLAQFLDKARFAGTKGNMITPAQLESKAGDLESKLVGFRRQIEELMTVSAARFEAPEKNLQWKISFISLYFVMVGNLLEARMLAELPNSDKRWADDQQLSIPLCTLSQISGFDGIEGWKNSEVLHDYLTKADSTIIVNIASLQRSINGKSLVKLGISQGYIEGHKSGAIANKSKQENFLKFFKLMAKKQLVNNFIEMNSYLEHPMALTSILGKDSPELRASKDAVAAEEEQAIRVGLIDNENFNFFQLERFAPPKGQGPYVSVPPTLSMLDDAQATDKKGKKLFEPVRDSEIAKLDQRILNAEAEGLQFFTRPMYNELLELLVPEPDSALGDSKSYTWVDDGEPSRLNAKNDDDAPLLPSGHFEPKGADPSRTVFGQNAKQFFSAKGLRRLEKDLYLPARRLEHLYFKTALANMLQTWPLPFVKMNYAERGESLRRIWGKAKALTLNPVLSRFLGRDIPIQKRIKISEWYERKVREYSERLPHQLLDDWIQKSMRNQKRQLHEKRVHKFLATLLDETKKLTKQLGDDKCLTNKVNFHELLASLEGDQGFSGLTTNDGAVGNIKGLFISMMTEYTGFLDASTADPSGKPKGWVAKTIHLIPILNDKVSRDWIIEKGGASAERVLKLQDEFMELVPLLANSDANVKQILDKKAALVSNLDQFSQNPSVQKSRLRHMKYLIETMKRDIFWLPEGIEKLSASDPTVYKDYRKLFAKEEEADYAKAAQRWRYFIEGGGIRDLSPAAKDQIKSWYEDTQLKALFGDKMLRDPKIFDHWPKDPGQSPLFKTPLVGATATSLARGTVRSIEWIGMRLGFEMNGANALSLNPRPSLLDLPLTNEQRNAFCKGKRDEVLGRPVLTQEIGIEDHKEPLYKRLARLNDSYSSSREEAIQHAEPLVNEAISVMIENAQTSLEELEKAKTISDLKGYARWFTIDAEIAEHYPQFATFQKQLKAVLNDFADRGWVGKITETMNKPFKIMLYHMEAKMVTMWFRPSTPGIAIITRLETSILPALHYLFTFGGYSMGIDMYKDYHAYQLEKEQYERENQLFYTSVDHSFFTWYQLESQHDKVDAMLTQMKMSAVTQLGMMYGSAALMKSKMAFVGWAESTIERATLGLGHVQVEGGPSVWDIHGTDHTSGHPEGHLEDLYRSKVQSCGNCTPAEIAKIKADYKFLKNIRDNSYRRLNTILNENAGVFRRLGMQPTLSQVQLAAGREAAALRNKLPHYDPNFLSDRDFRAAENDFNYLMHVAGNEAMAITPSPLKQKIWAFKNGWNRFIGNPAIPDLSSNRIFLTALTNDVLGLYMFGAPPLAHISLQQLVLKDYFQVLGVGRGDSPRQIEGAYVKLVTEAKTAEARFDIEEAYVNLVHPQARTFYEKWGKSFFDPDPSGYYEALGLHPSAGPEQIYKAYESIVKQLKKYVDPQAQAHLKSVEEAYRILTDPKKRVAYLRYGDPEADAPSADPVIPNRDPKGFYQLLEISPYVSMADVATAYQKAIKKLGPNKAKYSREDLEKYDALRKAFYHLSDSKKRLKYDVSGEGE